MARKQETQKGPSDERGLRIAHVFAVPGTGRRSAYATYLRYPRHIGVESARARVDGLRWPEGLATGRAMG